MHIPDHFLDPTVCAEDAIVAASALTWAASNARREPRASGPTLAVAAAGIFAVQMLNFPIAQGTSGHLVGGALAAIFFGPWLAMWLMTTVITVQGLLFGDGGIAALGTNILNMAVIAPWAGWVVYRFICNGQCGVPRRAIASAAAGWFSVVAAAVACAVELGISGASSPGKTLWAMGSIHALVGIAEALVTAAGAMLALRWSANASPAAGLLAATPDATSHRHGWIGWALAAVLVAAMAPLASNLPDAFESVAADLGFAAVGATNSLAAPVPDYQIPGIDSSALATILAGLLGVAACAALTWSADRLLPATSGTAIRKRAN